MRLLIAGLAALAAVSFTTPSFAQDDPPATPAPVPATKAKPSAASCQSQKTASARNSCLKKAQASTPKGTTSTTKKAKKPTATPTPTPATSKQPETSQMTPPPSAAPMQPSTGGTVAIPPLPQKTI